MNKLKIYPCSQHSIPTSSTHQSLYSGPMKSAYNITTSTEIQKLQ